MRVVTIRWPLARWQAPALAEGPPPVARAELGPQATPVRLTMTWGPKGSVRLAVGKAKPVTLGEGVAVGTLAASADRVVVALAVDDAAQPFRIFALDGAKPG